MFDEKLTSDDGEQKNSRSASALLAIIRFIGIYLLGCFNCVSINNIFRIKRLISNN